jgi:hypothetical protein
VVTVVETREVESVNTPTTAPTLSPPTHTDNSTDSLAADTHRQQHCGCPDAYLSA